MLLWITGHVGQLLAGAVTHADDAELGDGVELKEVADICLRALYHGYEPIWPQVLLQHGFGAVEHKNHVAEEASLVRSFVVTHSVHLVSFAIRLD